MNTNKQINHKNETMGINPSPVKTCVHYDMNELIVPKYVVNWSNGCYNMAKSTMFSINDAPVDTHMGKLVDAQIKNSFCSSYYIRKDSEHEINFTTEVRPHTGSARIYISDNVCTHVVLRFAGRAFLNHGLQIHVGNSAIAHITVITDVQSKAIACQSISIIVGKSAQVTTFVACKSCKRSVLNIHSTQFGSESVHNLYTLYSATDDDTIDMNYLMDVGACDCVANMYVMGSLSGCATKKFKGTLNFKKGCTNSKGEQAEEVLCLSDAVHAKAMPVILCGERDVDGKHSTSIGKIDNKQMFYLMARGLDAVEAQNLIISAHFSKLLANIKSPDDKEEILKLLKEEHNDWE